ncbi:MAG: type II toxin-antitoxin system VapC family toxin [Desulfobacterales bacterium]|nr:type II toxin-antitoxin system VapC family toxin [Desulfobacterales bacterium]
MKLLLDTHVFLWLLFAPEKVTTKVKLIYKDQKNVVFLSLISIWEIQIKSQLGKLYLDVDLEKIIDDNINKGFIKLLPIRLAHILSLKELPFHHKDPFDRLLIAQSIQENLTIVTADSYFTDYDAKTLW